MHLHLCVECGGAGGRSGPWVWPCSGTAGSAAVARIASAFLALRSGRQSALSQFSMHLNWGLRGDGSVLKVNHIA